MNSKEELLANENQFLLVALLKYLASKDGNLLGALVRDLEAQEAIIQSASPMRQQARLGAVVLAKQIQLNPHWTP